MRGRETWEKTKMKTTLAILAAVGLASVASAQTFPANAGTVPAVIPDNTGAASGGVDITFNVSGTSIGNSLENVSLTWTPAHTWAGDIVAVLTAPNGDNVHVMARLASGTTNGAGESSDLLGTYRFFDAGASFLTAGAAVAGGLPIAPGDYGRYTTLGGTTVPAADADGYSVFTGDNLNGTWTLRLSDWAGGDVGTVSASSITIVPTPGAMALLGLGGLAAARRRRA